jgi:hypothetical protein
MEGARAERATLVRSLRAIATRREVVLARLLPRRPPRLAKTQRPTASGTLLQLCNEGGQYAGLSTPDAFTLQSDGAYSALLKDWAPSNVQRAIF